MNKSEDLLRKMKKTTTKNINEVNCNQQKTEFALENSVTPDMIEDRFKEQG